MVCLMRSLGCGALLAVTFWAGGCLPSTQCVDSNDCPVGQSCAADGWCQYANGVRVLGGGGGSSSGGTSSSQAVGCVDLQTAPALRSCGVTLDVLNMTTPCVRMNFTRNAFPNAGSPVCTALIGGKIGGFVVHSDNPRTVTARLTVVGAGSGAVRSEQATAACNTASCSGGPSTFSTDGDARVFVEIGALGDNFSLELDGRP